ncbi:MAG: HAMP domain-containing sensor histidine kinase [Roseobacter sp.]|jgi:signal transduction histidine kinase|nr:HAMP domain-containing sensor histidine kinase [Roseobacter sp.]
MDTTASDNPRNPKALQPDVPQTRNEFEDFIYLISHDVRSSVRALIELPQWIAEDLQSAGVKLEGSVAESIELMNTHTGRLDRMLVDLLTFSRVGRMQELKEVEVDVMLTDILEEMRIPQGFRVSTDLAANTLYLGERDALTMITQLISNTIKHHDTGTGEISIQMAETDAGTVLRIIDDGPGILPQYRERAFSAMTTLRPRDEVEGSGMGLTIVRKIAHCYGGKVALSDVANGRGTVVTVSFPDRSIVAETMGACVRASNKKGH